MLLKQSILIEFTDDQASEFLNLFRDVRKLLNNKTEEIKTGQKEILTLNDACDFLNLSKPTIYSLTSKNQIPFIKKSKKLYFRTSELILWLNEGKQLTIKELKEEGEQRTRKR